MADWQEVEEREGKKFMQQLVDENIALRAENARLQQVSALTCDKCGWAMQFPGEECRNCGYERLRAENARLRDLIDEASKIYVSLTNDSDDKIKQIVTSIKRLKDS